MLEQAIIDAEALKEAALKNAEQAIIEKYSEEVKKNKKMCFICKIFRHRGTCWAWTRL